MKEYQDLFYLHKQNWQELTTEIQRSFKKYSVNKDILINILDSSEENNLLEALEQKIEKSKYILELQDDWDDEGAKSYNKETWDKAITFLRKFTEWAYSENIFFDCPNIYHGDEGSIDILWKTKDYDLLLNIEETSSDIAFYGESKKDEDIVLQGKFNSG